MGIRKAPLSGIQVSSTVESYEKLIEQMYGERPVIVFCTRTERRTDGRHAWTGKAVVGHGWDITFLGQRQRFEFLDSGAKWICKLAEARTEAV